VLRVEHRWSTTETPGARSDAMAIGSAEDLDGGAERHSSHPIAVIDAALAKYRIHDPQFTQRNADLTFAEHNALLRPSQRRLRSAAWIGSSNRGPHRAVKGRYRA